MSQENQETETTAGDKALTVSTGPEIANAGLVTKLVEHRVYKDREDGVVFVCISGPDKHGDCMVLSLPSGVGHSRDVGYAHFESDAYVEVSRSLVDYFISQNVKD